MTNYIPLIKSPKRNLPIPYTDYYTAEELNLYLRMYYTRTANDTGAAYIAPYVVWKYLNGTYDSTRTLTLNIEDPTEDTTGSYYGSVVFQSKNGYWFWTKGNDSTFTTKLKAPDYLGLSGEILKSNLAWVDNSSSELGYQIIRSVNSGSWQYIDTTLPNVTTYMDSGDFVGEESVRYYIKALGSYTNSDSVSFGSTVIQQPEYTSLVFDPDPATYEMDSTATIINTSGSYVLDNDFESGTTGLTLTTNGGGTFVTSAEARYSGSYGAKLTWGTSRTVNGRWDTVPNADTMMIGFRFRIPSGDYIGTSGGYELFRYDMTTTQIVGMSYLKTAGGKLDVWFYYNHNTQVLWETTTFDFNTWYDVQMFWVQGTNKPCSLWVNSSLVGSASNFTTDGWGVPNDLRFGGTSGTSPTSGHIMHLDDLAFDTTGAIKIYEGGGGGITDTLVYADSSVYVEFKNLGLTPTDVDTMYFSPSYLPTEVFKIPATTYPITIGAEDSVNVEFVVDRDHTGGIYDNILTVQTTNNEVTNYQYLPFRVTITGEEVLPDTTSPYPVTSLTATGYNQNGSTYAVLNWTGSSSTDVDYYTVYKDSGKTYVSGDSIGFRSFGVNTYTDTLPTANSYWSYLVTTTDDSGNVSYGNPSDSAFIPADPIPLQTPNPPSNLNGVGDTLAVHLTWVDNSNDEWGFLVERNSVQIDSLAANTIAYTDTPLANNTSYTYRVRASNEYGRSAYSNTKTVTTSDTTTYVPGDYDIWYVSNNGTGDGTTRANPANWYLFNQSQIQPGDFVYFKEGTYPSEFYPTKSGTSTELVTYMADPTNTEVVEFQGNNSNGLWITNISYIRVKQLNSRKSLVGAKIGMNTNVIYLDSCYTRKTINSALSITGFSGNPNPEYSTIDSIFIRWCDFKSDSLYNLQTDVISGNSWNNLYIYGCRIWQANSIGIGHNDCIQITGRCGDTFIYNNYFINEKATYSQLMMTNGGASVGALGWHHVIYNNIMIFRATPIGILNDSNPIYGDQNGGTSLYHNTVVAENKSINGSGDTSYAKNNIWVNYGTGANVVMFQSWQNNTPSHLDYNFYYAPNTASPSFLYGDATGKTWAQWQALGYDPNTSYQVNPLFTNCTSNYTVQPEGLTLQAGSPARLFGPNLKSIIEGYGLPWETFNNPYVTGATGGARPSSGSVNIGAW